MKTSSLLLLAVCILMLGLCFQWKEGRENRENLHALAERVKTAPDSPLKEGKPGVITLKHGAVPASIPRGAGVCTVAEFAALAEGGEMILSMPRLILRKTGGAPWKTVEDAQNVVSAVQIQVTQEDFNFLHVFFPDRTIGKDGLVLVDECTVATSFPSNMAEGVLLFKQAEYKIEVQASLVQDSDILTLSASLEAGDKNIIDVATMGKQSSGTIVGPVVLVKD